MQELKAVRILLPVQAAADKTLALHDRLHGNQQFPPGLYFGHETPRTQIECFPYHIRRGFLSQEDDSCVGRNLTDLPRRVESIQPWQTDIEEDQVGLQRPG